MSDEVLRDFLQPLQAEVESSGQFTIDAMAALRKLARSQLPSPGLWPVKLVQGAVARGVVDVEIKQSAAQLQVVLRGGRETSALSLLEELLSGQLSSDRSDAHLIAGLRGAYGRGLVSLSWISSHADRQELVTLSSGEVFSENVPHSGPLKFELVVLATYEMSRWSMARPSAEEYKALCDRCKLCPVRVTIDSRLISRQPPETFASQSGRLVWVADATPGAPSVKMHSPAKASSLNKWMVRRFPQGSPCRGSMLIWAYGLESSGSVERFKVYWLCDGALIGPYLIADWRGPIHGEVVLPGDGLMTDLTGWAIRQAETVFPATAVLAALREVNEQLEERHPPPSTQARLLSHVKESAIWLAVNVPVITLTLGSGVVGDPFNRGAGRTSKANLLAGMKSICAVETIRLSQAEDEALEI